MSFYLKAIFLYIVLLATITFVLAEELPKCTTKDFHGNYFDLSPLTKTSGDDWVVDGADTEMQFRINICAELVYKQTGLKNPDGVASFGHDKSLANFDLGKTNTAPFFRGEKLLLQYQNGDECPRDSSKHRSTLISFICDTGVTNLGKPVFVSDADQCFYWFEWATPAACATSQSVSGITGWGIFFTIAFVLTSAYCLGGVCYMRVVHNASGFQQIPNWEFWYNIYDWTKDMTIILIGMAYSYIQPRSSNTYRGLPRDEDDGDNLIDDFEIREG